MQRITLLAVMFIAICYSKLLAQVGIHTTDPAPGVSLHIKDDFESIRLDGSSPFISFYNGQDYRGYLYMTGDNMYLYNRKSGNIFFGANNASKMTINSAGDIGMGTSLPKTRLHVAEGLLSNAAFNSNTIAGLEKSTGNGYLSIITNSSTENGILFGDQTSGQKAAIIYNNGANPDGLQFRTNNNNTRMSIDANGYVGVGISNPLRPLHIKSRNGGDEYGIRLDRSGSSVNWELSVFGGNMCFFYNSALTATALITTSGTYSSSDRRLKKNIRPYKKVLPLLQQLEVDSYEFIAGEDAGPSMGLIAQDVAKIYPEIVRKTSNRAGEPYYFIDYSKTGVLALKAIQEMQADITIKQHENKLLTQRVKSLEEKNEQLQQRLLEMENAILKLQQL